MNPLMKIKVTAIGAMNLIINLQILKMRVDNESSVATIFFFTIKPTKIAIINPPSGSITLEVNVSSRSKKVISKNFISDNRLNDSNVPNPINQVIKPMRYVASILSKENLSIR